MSLKIAMLFAGFAALVGVGSSVTSSAGLFLWDSEGSVELSIKQMELTCPEKKLKK